MAGIVAAVCTALIALVFARANLGSARRLVGSPVRGVVAIIDSSTAVDDIFNGQFCGGVIVRPDAVLTAAHCLGARAATAIDVVVGANNLCRGQPIDGVRSKVLAVAIDGRYNSVTGDHDLAILRLARAFPGASRDIARAQSVDVSVAI